MKKTDKINGRSIFNTAPPLLGVVKELGSIRPLSDTTGRMTVVCNHCEGIFTRFASHVRRRAKNYCSVACRNEGLKIEVETSCVVCDTLMIQSPVLSERVRTCSKECSLLRKRGPTLKRGWPEYKAIVKQTSDLSLCSQCGATSGPWVVRGILDKATSHPSLWCRSCHLKDLQMKANAAKQASPEALEKAKRMLEKHGYSVADKS